MNPLDSLKRLAHRIEAGEVVFFIGAGFSIDSEGNTAARLMRRLLVRFASLVSELTEWTIFPSAGTSVGSDLLNSLHHEVDGLASSLRRTFNLNATKPGESDLTWLFDDEWDNGRLLAKSDVNLLAVKYFEANDWFCRTFQRLLQIANLLISQKAGAAAATSDAASKSASASNGQWSQLLRNPEFCQQLCRFIQAVSKRENAQLALAGQKPDPVALQPIDIRLFLWARQGSDQTTADRVQGAGKALFLDTMGFSEPEIMGGNWQLDAFRVPGSYHGKLFPRFHVLARLAREGMSPTILTTNYDLLLEGAWRTAGFEAERVDRGRLVEDHLMPSVPVREMARIGKATEFFRYGRGSTTANVIKVHGCVDLYREARNAGAVNMDDWLQVNSPESADDPDAVAPVGSQEPDSSTLSGISWDSWREYLPSMVFTYREIQNWREDSWTRDFLATIQRTRTVVFCGYSLQDPVLHDTFRSVYEDMARQRFRTDGHKTDHGKTVASEAPAFFWTPANDPSFYASEVLDSASAATGHVRSQRSNHPNTLAYRFRHDDPRKGFPDLDENFLLLFHQIFRNQQRRCIVTDLPQVLSSLLNRLVLKSELRCFRDVFESIVSNEDAQFRMAFDATLDVPRVKTIEFEGTKPTQNLDSLRREFCDTVNWTYQFGAMLLREMAAIELLQRSSGHSLELARMRTPGWYLPTRANRSATAWSAVVEVAIRYLFGFQSHGSGNRQVVSGACCVPADCNWPMVYCRLPAIDSSRSLSPDPFALQIVTGEETVRQLSDLGPVMSHYIIQWRLPINRFPWPAIQAREKKPSRKQKNDPETWQGSTLIRTLPAPDAGVLWSLAIDDADAATHRTRLIRDLAIPFNLNVSHD